MEFHPSKVSYRHSNPQLWHLIKVRGSSPRLHTIHFPSQTLTINTYPILLACQTSITLSLKHSFMVSIISSTSYPLSDYQHILLYILLTIIFSIFSTWPTTGACLPQSFHLPTSSLRTTLLSILLIPSNPLRLSICTALFQDLSFYFHNIISLPYIRRGTSNVWCKTQANSSCKSLALTWGPDGTCHPPHTCHLPTTLCLICTWFVQNTPPNI